MGFSLTFMRLHGNADADADRDGLANFLRERGLEVAPSNDDTHHLTGPDGDLTFDGSWTDLHLDPLDQEGPVTGGIWHATLSEQECAFIYDLCVAGRMLIVNPQGSPVFVVPGRTHLPEDIPDDTDPQEAAWVDSPEELEAALSGDFEQFVQYRDQVIDDSGGRPERSAGLIDRARRVIRDTPGTLARLIGRRAPSDDDPSESAKPREDTALHEAAKELSPESVQQQLDAGADPDALDSWEWTPLDLVAFGTEYWRAGEGLATARVLLPAAEEKTIASDAASHLRGEFRDAHRAHEHGNLTDEKLQSFRELLKLLSVPEPAVVKPLAPGEPITVSSEGWKAQYSELWQLLVPENGAAESVQGEVIRIAGRVGYEILTNGGGNWDEDFEAMLDTFLEFTAGGEPLPPAEHDGTRRARESLRGGLFCEEDVDEITRASVAWVLLNPDRIPLPSPSYER